jgi:uncharacterized membrane protein YjfL (UPF0719 family)
VVLLGFISTFDDDGVLLLIGSAVISVIGFVRWATRLRPVLKLGSNPLQRLPLYAAFLIGFALIALVVWRWADQQIRDNSGYVLLVFLMGGAWLAVTAAVFPWLGIGLRDDAFEQRNFAAVLALSGAVLAVLLIFAGANTGDGPSFWNNVFSGGLATAALLLLWLLVTAFGRAHVSIAEDRDVASGVRFGGFLFATGLILARAVAGDWHSSAQTALDLLRDGGLVLPLALVAVIAEAGLRPSAEKSSGREWRGEYHAPAGNWPRENP